MPEPEQMLDFRGLAAAAAAAAKPDYADVVARAARRRKRRGWFGASFVALAVLLGGGTTYALTADRTPRPVKPPVEVIKPWRAIVPPGAPGPKPQPSYYEIEPGAYDVTEADKPLTGLFTELQAGDLNHLYLHYQDCRTQKKPCQQMLASSTDRGRTWRKSPLPVARPGMAPTGVSIVHGSVVLAGSHVDFRSGSHDTGEEPPPDFWMSRDAGLTWQPAPLREVDALPKGGPVADFSSGMYAMDPATGTVARKKFENSFDQPMIFASLPNGELWGRSDARSVEVSSDGGKTWEKRPLPDLAPPGQSGSSMNRYDVSTTDGRTIYARAKRRTGVKLFTSADAGRTWEPRAELDLGGPSLSVLPIGDRTVIVEGVKGTYRSTDGGRTFTRVGPSLGARAHAIPGGGYTIPTNNNEYSAWISPDGAEWTYVRHPEVP
jgi:hypothetical protein